MLPSASLVTKPKLISTFSSLDSGVSFVLIPNSFSRALRLSDLISEVPSNKSSYVRVRASGSSPDL
jgi:hypothetical protein